MADSTTELKQLLFRYINEYKGIDKLREVLQTTSVEDRYKALMSVRGDHQYTAVHEGAITNNMDTIKYMMAGFTSDQQYNVLSVLSSYNGTALHYTAYYNSDTAIVMYLLSNLSIRQRYNLLRMQDSVGGTALHDAATKKHKSVLQVMLSSVTTDQQKLLLNIKNNKNKTIADITSLPELAYDAAAWTRLDLDDTSVALNNTKEELDSTKGMLDRVKEELTELKESHKSAVARQDAELSSTKEKLDNTKDELGALKECHESTVARQDAELCSTREELSNTREELSNTREELSNTREELNSAKENVDSTIDELTALIESHQQQGEIIASQAEAMTASSKQMEELVKQNKDLEKDNNQQSKAVIQMISDVGEQRRLVERETNQRVQELSALKETHEAVVAGQDAELQQLRYNQTEMLRMIDALEISMGRPTSDQENEC